MQNEFPAAAETGQQSAYWAGFYEKAWAERARFIETLIQQGETNPARLLGLLNSKERKYELRLNNENGQTLYAKRYAEVPGLCPTGVPVMRTTSYLGNYTQVPFYAEVPLHRYIIDYFDEKGPFDCIVELGCGMGENLFKMHNDGGPSVPYYGGEFTESGVILGRKLAALDPRLNVQFFQFNHLKPDLSVLPRYKKILVFTMHTIEQVNRVTTDLLSTIAQAAEQVTCVHLEPFGFQMNTQGEARQKQKQFFEKVGWNVNLADVLKKGHAQKIIRLNYVDLDLFYSIDSSNGTSVAIWHAGAP